MSKGKAIVVSFEGPDGVGKSTQVKSVKEALETSGKSVAIAKLPAYDTFTGKLIRWMLNNGLALRLANTFQTIQWLDKIIFQAFRLRALLREYDFVLLDRWHASMWAYGLAGGANERLTDLFVNSIYEPNAVLVFYGNCKRQTSEDFYEADTSLQKSVRLHYVLWCCARNSNSFPINANATKDAVTREALAAIYSIT